MMKFSPAEARYYRGDALASAPQDAFELSDVQEAFVMQKKAAGYIVRFEGGEFIAYHPDNPPADMKWQALRVERDALLARCDWTQGRDSPLSEAKIAEWAAYRQALRNLPASTTDIDNPSWPISPE